jgi:hypothetical protein
MNNADIYQAVILRAVNGLKANPLRVDDLARLKRICQHLADCEEAQRLMQRKGYGKVGMSFLDIVASVPPNPLKWLSGAFRPVTLKSLEDQTKLAEAFDIWSSR